MTRFSAGKSFGTAFRVIARKLLGFPIEEERPKPIIRYVEASYTIYVKPLHVYNDANELVCTLFKRKLTKTQIRKLKRQLEMLDQLEELND